MEQNKHRYRQVNSSLGKSPTIGPIPADQLFPWAIIIVFSLLLRELLELDFIWTLAIIAWGISTWWILTANGSWRILSKFINPPNWVRVRVTYKSILQKRK